jgi:hypothetical protein
VVVVLVAMRVRERRAHARLEVALKAAEPDTPAQADADVSER